MENSKRIEKFKKNLNVFSKKSKFIAKKYNLIPIIITVLLIVSVGLLAVGPTLAYMTSESSTPKNEFTFVSTNIDGENDMKLQLTETEWDKDEAIGFLPGRTVKKNPVLTNISSGDVSEYVAIRIIFEKVNTDDSTTTMNDDELAAIMDVFDIDWNTTKWSRNGELTPTTIFDYKEPLAKDSKTEPLFTEVTMKTDATRAQLKAINDIEGMKSFNIKIQGAAIQENVFENIEGAKTELHALFPTE